MKRVYLMRIACGLVSMIFFVGAVINLFKKNSFNPRLLGFNCKKYFYLTRKQTILIKVIISGLIGWLKNKYVTKNLFFT